MAHRPTRFLFALTVVLCSQAALADPGHVDFCAEQPSGIVAWWPLDEGAGTSAEEIVNGNDGALANGPTPIAGEVAGAYQFDGTNDYVSVPNDPTLNFDASTGGDTGDLSIDAWIRTSATAGVQVILDKRTFTPTRGYVLFVLDGKLGFQLADAGGPGDTCGSSPADACRTYDSGVLVATGNWVHVAVTVDRDVPTGVRFYVDGSQTSGTFDATTKQGSLINGAPLSIGRRSDATAHFPGALDEVEIFERALTPEEVALVHGVGSRGKCKCLDRPAGLVSWWPADDCLATDRIGGNHGTFFGSPACPFDPKVGDGAWGGLGSSGPTYVEVAHHASLNFGLDDFSIDGWIRTSAADATVVQKGGPLGRLFALSLAGGKLRFDACDDQICSSVESSALVDSGSWRLVGVTFERTAEVSQGVTDVVVTLYVDGLPDAAANFTLGLVDTTANLSIGAGSGGYFTGEMDEVEIFTRALSSVEMLALQNVDRYGKCKCEEPPPNMIAWWPFDEPLGPTASDLVGGHHGVYSGAPVPVPGCVAGALDFNGGPDRVDVPHHPDLNFGKGDSTVDFWAYNEDDLLGAHDVFIQKWGVYVVRYDSGGGAHLHLEGSAPFLSVVLPPNEWKHVAITFEQGVPGKIKGYRDGELKATRPPPGPSVYDVTSLADVVIGNGAGKLKGILDELELYNRALSPGEILGLARAGSYGKCKTTRLPRTTDIQIVKAVDDLTPIAGSLVTFQVFVTNLSPEPVQSVIVHDQLPPGLVPVSASISGNGGTYNKYSGQLIISSIAGQSSAALTVVAFVDTCSPTTNCATFKGAGTADSNAANDVSCVQITPETPCAEIHGIKFRDDDRNGLPSTFEPPIQGQTIRLTSAGGQVSTQVTGVTGAFSFLPLAPGTWKLSEILQPNQVMISPPGGSQTTVLSSGGQSFGNDFANYQCPSGPGPACAEPPLDLVEWWPLDSIQSGTAGCAYTSGIVRNARDRVFGAPAGASSCGVTAAGKRDGAISFDGANDYVEAPDHPSLNFGPAAGSSGDFSIDAWVKTTSIELQVILDKRREDTPGGVQGYALFTFGGNVLLQLANAAGITNYDSGVAVNDNQWHHVAVTVDRDSSTGVQFTIDGAAGANGNPTLHVGTLANPMPLRIARRSDSTGPGFFAGSIDEVEIFRRVLTPQEIQDIFNVGKCKRVIPHAQKILPVCTNFSSVATPITLCNWTGLTLPIRWSLAGLPASSGCSIAGPTVFSPVAGVTAPVDPGACTTVMVTIARPTGLGVGATSCFQLTALQSNNGRCTSASGALVGDPAWCVPVDVFSDVAVIQAGPGSEAVDFDVANAGSDETLDYRLRVVPSDAGLAGSEVVSLNGLPPGTPVTGSVAILPSQEAPVSVSVEYLGQDALRFHDLLLEADTDGNGEFEPLSSMGLRSASADAVPEACPGIASEEIVLAWSSRTRLLWTGPACPAVYNVYRHDGVLTDLDGDLLADDYGNCFEVGLTEREAFDVSFPAGSSYHSYLVTAVNPSGESSLGNATVGPRPNAEPCP